MNEDLQGLSVEELVSPCLMEEPGAWDETDGRTRCYLERCVGRIFSEMFVAAMGQDQLPLAGGLMAPRWRGPSWGRAGRGFRGVGRGGPGRNAERLDRQGFLVTQATAKE